jgi:hypothetical protein
MARMSIKKALWWVESLSRNYGGSLHKQAVKIIRANIKESRPTVRKAVQQAKGKPCPYHRYSGCCHYAPYNMLCPKEPCR